MSRPGRIELSGMVRVMWTLRCIFALSLVASCAGDKEAKPVQVTTPGASTQTPPPADDGKVEAKAIEAPPVGEIGQTKTYTVTISTAGKDLMTSVRVLRKVSGLKVGEVKALIDGVPSEVKTGLSISEAEAMLTELKEAGFAAEMTASGDAAEASGADAEVTHSVFLTDFGSKKIHVIKIVRQYTKLGLKDTKELVESAPVELKAGLSKAEAEAMLAELQAVGAAAEVK